MSELEELLNSAMHEIRDLRRRNEILTAKVEMIDLFACVLNTQPAHPGARAGLDIAWAIQKKLNELQEQNKRD